MALLPERFAEVVSAFLVHPFWEAEPEHQDYLERYPNGYTCHFVPSSRRACLGGLRTGVELATLWACQG